MEECDDSSRGYWPVGAVIVVVVMGDIDGG